MVQAPLCEQCSGLTKKGLRCKLKSSCRIGCQKFCFRHAFKHIKLPGALKGTCTDVSKNYCGRNSSTVGNGVEVRLSNIPNAGFGLFTTKNFKKGDTITEYDGKIIDRRTALQLRSEHKDTHLVALTTQHSAIDGLKKPIHGRGGASFANDINDTRRYNVVFCKTFKVIPGLQDTRTGDFSDLTRVFLKATRDIQNGEEIYVNYGKSTRDRLI